MDESKRWSNLAKHGVDFAIAAAAFDDPDHIDRPSGRDVLEPRREIIGRVGDYLCFVALHSTGQRLSIDLGAEGQST